ncbi:MAG TPA: hypothetical protein PK573_16360 [Spirochaetota bacterium]|nr:hypothetical protein [Spirochaetota bacterium]
METSSHYYAILAFCRAIGYNKEASFKIAYASQFVDDAKINLITVKNPDPAVKFETINSRPALFDMATCHSYFKIDTFNYLSMIYNTSAFHFPPGCIGASFTKKMRCGEKSPVIERIIKEALRESNEAAFKKAGVPKDPTADFSDFELIRLGMLLHVYADSYSHQGFSGILADENNIYDLRFHGNKALLHGPLEKIRKKIKAIIDRILDNTVPCYGHAQAFECPDEPYLEWSYFYDDSTDQSGKRTFSEAISNPDRYGRAFKDIAGMLEVFLRSRKQYKEGSCKSNLKELYEMLVSEHRSDEKINRWKKLMIENGYFDKKDPELDYDDNQWIREAFADYNEKRYHKRKVEDALLAANFRGSSWHKYYFAARWYKKEFLKTCKGLKLEISV